MKPITLLTICLLFGHAGFGLGAEDETLFAGHDYVVKHVMILAVVWMFL